MRTAWIIGLAMCYVLLTLVSGIDEGSYFGGTGVETLWSGFNAIKVIDFTNISTLVSGIQVALHDVFVGLFEIMTWRFSFFTGAFAIFRFVLSAISLGVIISVMMALRGTSSG